MFVRVCVYCQRTKFSIDFKNQEVVWACYIVKDLNVRRKVGQEINEEQKQLLVRIKIVLEEQ